jgi:alpha-methylacyl-CoA racemase
MTPLEGFRVLELASVAPAPLAAQILADFGAEVIVVERPGGLGAGLVGLEGYPMFCRGKTRIEADLKSSDGRARVLELADRADVLIEGYRPGVAERLGLGPDVLCERNPGLIYTRLTGWGQTGPYAQRAGHDINYVAVAGALGVVGWDEPVPPGTFAGDYGGGTLHAVIGILLALQARHLTGEGQVVDVAMAEGALTLLSGHLELRARERLESRGLNATDGRAPFYGSYRCADGRWYAVGAIEPQFYATLLDALGLHDVDPAAQMDRHTWPELRERFAGVFATKTRDEWEALLGDRDACGAPVLDIDELGAHPQLHHRDAVRPLDGCWEPMPAPRLSDTPGAPGLRQDVQPTAAWRPRE